jgi:hypothetical protein
LSRVEDNDITDAPPKSHSRKSETR